MEWQPERNRRVGRPKTTWRRMMKKESRHERWSSWAEVRDTAQDSLASRQEKVAALFSSWHGEN